MLPDNSDKSIDAEVLRMFELTGQWAKERRIIQNSDLKTQALKLNSEFGEMCYNIAHGKDIADDLGDCCVVLCNLAYMANLDIKNIIADIGMYSPAIENSVLIFGSENGKLADDIIKGLPIHKHIVSLYKILIFISMQYEQIPLLYCWEEAYDEIKNRKGILTKSGVFVKDSDPHYQEIMEKE